ncbi:MAG: dTDP-4-dehydrorhamnose reductase [Bacteroidota bacterium]|jgi:dTDP-4-dehydrorhamnose reductase|nr:dTDP-4-dehydrorhamnose reductase [Bacteroidales bacterium]MDI9534968.1 dTDP-4-dehydrorhamnose reductase [Bacteroidota bacterium]OQC45267.1 MAG: dTDP-4-dehydrorhamnose reductase [Bacteroidetes bacterium ADurb.Bin028]NLP20848.1 dTDP-4-dehydrorhamnose reductase [Bacteroidales bacterium]HNY43691.1 dTDP-4-dehydrorhamnose reductase [Bacteroidales bacterium]
MKILVTGSKGQLGSKIKDLSVDFQSFSFSFTDLDELDITNFNSVLDFFKFEKPDIVINCAAYTAVDKAEDDYENAFKINALGPENLAKACNVHNSKFIHISTDYVFDGKEREKPYLESDFTSPQSVYGSTKLEGENLVLKNLQDAIIVRTAWLYSEYGHNFVKTMLNLAQSRTELSVVNDQVGSPTYAGDLAQAILQISMQYFEENYWKSGVYHFSNLGKCTWFEFAKEIFKIKNINIKVNPVTSEEFPSKVKRPKYSVLDKEKIITTYKIDVPDWRDSLKIVLEKL